MMRSPELVLCVHIRLILAQEEDDVSCTAESSDVQGCAVVNIACENISTVGQ